MTIDIKLRQSHRKNMQEKKAQKPIPNKLNENMIKSQKEKG